MNCSCGRPSSPDPSMVIGIQRDENDCPYCILYNCACQSTRAVPWAEASHVIKAAAIEKEMERIRGATGVQ